MFLNHLHESSVRCHVELYNLPACHKESGALRYVYYGKRLGTVTELPISLRTMSSERKRLYIQI